MSTVGDLMDGEFLLLFHRSQEKLKVEKQVSVFSTMLFPLDKHKEKHLTHSFFLI